MTRTSTHLIAYETRTSTHLITYEMNIPLLFDQNVKIYHMHNVDTNVDILISINCQSYQLFGYVKDNKSYITSNKKVLVLLF